MPAGRFFLVAGIATLLVVGAALLPALAVAALVVDGLLLAAFLIDLRRAARTPLSAVRDWPPLLVQGLSAEVGVEVTSGASRTVRLRLREGLHPGLAEAPVRSESNLAPGGRYRWDLRLLPGLRGEHEVAPLTARVAGPWGLAWGQRDLLPPERRRVYPQIRWEGRVGHLLSRAQRHRLGQLPLRLHGGGTEPYALREYLPGDPLTHIHWKATARHDRLVSREDTWERGAHLVVLLDCARAMSSADGKRSKLDHALAAALALVRVAAARGDAVTLVAFSDRVERTARVFPGSRGLAATYGAFYDLSARPVEPAYDLAAEAALDLERRSATVTLLTSVVDLAAAELLREALLQLERRHRPLLINLEDPEIRGLARRAPATAVEAFAQVSALEILIANRRLARRLQRAGIRAVNAPADLLALATLDAYLALFRGRGAGVRRSSNRRFTTEARADR